MVAVGQPIERLFVADQHGLVAAPQPEPIAAVVGFVPDEGVARTPGLDAIVIGVRGVILNKHVSPRHPPIERSNEDAGAPCGCRSIP